MSGLGVNIYQYSETDLTALANQAKDAILCALSNEDILKGDPLEIAQDYVIVIYKKGWFGRQWDKWRGLKDNETYMVVLKNISLDTPSDEDEENPADTRYLRGVVRGWPK